MNNIEKNEKILMTKKRKNKNPNLCYLRRVFTKYNLQSFLVLIS